MGCGCAFPPNHSICGEEDFCSRECYAVEIIREVRRMTREPDPLMACKNIELMLKRLHSSERFVIPMLEYGGGKWSNI